jgi:DNA-binding transcriptional ArsR family regulator
MGADLDAAFFALAAPARRDIVDALRRSPESASALAERLALARPTLSKHLRVLRDAGLIEQAKTPTDGRMRLVQLRREPFGELRKWLDEVESFWADQLDAFRRHAERRHREHKP